MAIVKSVPLVPLMAQVAETHIYKWTYLQISIQYYVPYQITIYSC